MRLAVVGAGGIAKLESTLAFDFDVRFCTRSAHVAPDADLILVCRPPERLSGELRRLRAHTRVPIVALLGAGAAADRIRALENGADDVVCVPYDPMELLARLRTVVRRAQRGSEVIRAADIELDAQRHEVRCGAESVRLSPTEFALLASLAVRAGQVVRTETLAEELWGAADETSTRNVYTYIKYLRNKLGVSAKPPLIRTLRGLGYELIPCERSA